MEKFAVVEVGSTTTKGYLYDNGRITVLDFVLIEFKKNYNANKEILESDRVKLYDYIKRINEAFSNIFVYGTSIFRSLTDSQREEFLTEFKNKTGFDFNIVSSVDEAKYTVAGAVANIDYDDNVAVVIGGGGSVEIAITKDKEIIENINLSIGCVDVTNVFPDLANEYAKIDIREVIDYVKERIVEVHNKADILVLAGGANKYFREKAYYQFVDEVPFNYNKQEMVIMDASTLIIQDRRYFYYTSLEDMKKNMPDSPNWWNPTRATAAIIEAVSELIDAKYVAASDINMIYGIIEELKDKEQKNMLG